MAPLLLLNLGTIDFLQPQPPAIRCLTPQRADSTLTPNNSNFESFTNINAAQVSEAILPVPDAYTVPLDGEQSPVVDLNYIMGERSLQNLPVERLLHIAQGRNLAGAVDLRLVTQREAALLRTILANAFCVQRLQLGNDRLSPNDWVEVFAALPNPHQLKVLELVKSSIDGDALNSVLDELPKLEKLVLRHCSRISPNLIRDVHAQRPGLGIVYERDEDGGTASGALNAST